MKYYKPGLFALVVLPFIAIATACSSSEASEAKSPEQVQQDTKAWVLEDVRSACDEYGNRVYKYRGYKKGGIDVIPNDPTCNSN